MTPSTVAPQPVQFTPTPPFPRFDSPNFPDLLLFERDLANFIAQYPTTPLPHLSALIHPEILAALQETAGPVSDSASVLDLLENLLRPADAAERLSMLRSLRFDPVAPPFALALARHVANFRTLASALKASDHLARKAFVASLGGGPFGQTVDLHLKSSFADDPIGRRVQALAGAFFPSTTTPTTTTSAAAATTATSTTVLDYRVLPLATDAGDEPGPDATGPPAPSDWVDTPSSHQAVRDAFQQALRGARRAPPRTSPVPDQRTLEYAILVAKAVAQAAGGLGFAPIFPTSSPTAPFVVPRATPAFPFATPSPTATSAPSYAHAYQPPPPTPAPFPAPVASVFPSTPPPRLQLFYHPAALPPPVTLPPPAPAGPFSAPNPNPFAGLRRLKYLGLPGFEPVTLAIRIKRPTG
ncbi:hypothetical protein PAPYR_11400 [Paratrimastix pyriformis]|uniref:Uncharacterized protein n=1 Tax=Paratrimastix pyriformis TaxID=342808 RepID=A0ABQ8U5L5_9EUKA|nr:hypothetical protein PAPYR_11400 [Paratrimastix pyriformis]